jgi:hypothetical protein
METEQPKPPESEPIKNTPPPPTIREQITGIIAAIIIGVLLVWFVVGELNTTTPSQPKAIPSEDTSAKHYSYVLDFVKSNATHPSTVDFCSLLNRVIKTQKEPDGGYLHAYRNCMTAKNSFGVELKYDWVVVIKESTTGQVSVVDWDIIEE